MTHQSFTETAEKQDLVVTHLFDVPVQQAWEAWVDPRLVKQWWGPDGFTCPLAQIDFRVGGTSLVCMSSPQFGDHYSTWHYREIVPLKRIVYIQNLTDPGGNPIDPTSAGLPADFPQHMLTSLTLRALSDRQTEVTVKEYGWTPGSMMEMSRMGLEQCLDKMASIFA